MVVFLWWCSCAGVFAVMFLWWWWCGGVFGGGVFTVLTWCFCGVVFCGGVFVVVSSGPRTRTFRCFARLWFCGGAFAGGGVVNIRPENSYFSVFCKIVVLSWCFWCFCGGVNIRPENSYFSVFCKIVVNMFWSVLSRSCHLHVT